MARQCPECHGVITDDRLGRCVSCGCKLPGEKFQRKWEDRMVPYIGIAVLIALIVAATLYLLYRRAG
jgi:hypothetical protein